MSGQAPFLHSTLSEQIIGAAMAVSNELFPGLSEKLHERALMIELTNRGLQVSQQQAYPVAYKGQVIGSLQPDLIVEKLIIVDTKVVESFNDSHMKQVYGYLAVTGIELGLLLNFKYAKLQWKRIIRTPDSIAK